MKVGGQRAVFADLFHGFPMTERVLHQDFNATQYFQWGIGEQYEILALDLRNPVTGLSTHVGKGLV